jgi:hypothetical protein
MSGTLWMVFGKEVKHLCILGQHQVGKETKHATVCLFGLLEQQGTETNFVPKQFGASPLLQCKCSATSEQAGSKGIRETIQ